MKMVFLWKSVAFYLWEILRKTLSVYIIYSSYYNKKMSQKQKNKNQTIFFLQKIKKIGTHKVCIKFYN